MVFHVGTLETNGSPNWVETFVAVLCVKLVGA